MKIQNDVEGVQYPPIMYNWYTKCTSSNIHGDGALLDEEAMKIKKRLDKEELSDFTASNGWLDSWKKIYGVQEKGLFGQADDVSKKTIEVYVEQLLELCQWYEPQNILNLEKLGLFFKALPENGLAEKISKVKAKKKWVCFSMW